MIVKKYFKFSCILRFGSVAWLGSVWLYRTYIVVFILYIVSGHIKCIWICMT